MEACRCSSHMCADNYLTLSQCLPLYMGLTEVFKTDNTQSEKIKKIPIKGFSNGNDNGINGWMQEWKDLGK